LQVVKPIFIIGAPRSGTTLLYNILAAHRDLSYVTLNVLRAGIHRKGRFLGHRKGLLLKIINLFYRDKRSRIPHEANNFWKRYLGIYNYLTEEDYIPEMTDYYKLLVHTVQKAFGKPRFINKNPQHSFRVRLLNKIFDDAKFIHIIRDGRPAAYSMIIKIKTEPNDSYSVNLKHKILGQQYRYDRSKLYNYGLAWQVMVSRAREASAFGNAKYHELHYEELIARPTDTIKAILNFCELEWYDVFTKSIPPIRNENVKWKQDLSKQEQIDVEESTYELRSSLMYL
jgi:omega-hydroxy-beta-dihydromenaquinone-9 sulfotransferase